MSPSVELVSPEIPRRRHLDGRPAVGLDVFKSTQANVVEVVDRVLAVIEKNKALPQMQGIRVFTIDNQAEAIRTSLSDLTEAGLIGAALAFMVLFMFLRHWPTTLIVSASVPLSLLVTLAVMYFVGLTINVMSMMGMMLAIGMLVDNAVVVTESVFRHRQLDPAQSAGGDARRRQGSRRRHARRHGHLRRGVPARSCSAPTTRSPSG